MEQLAQFLRQSFPALASLILGLLGGGVGGYMLYSVVNSVEPIEVIRPVGSNDIWQVARGHKAGSGTLVLHKSNTDVLSEVETPELEEIQTYVPCHIVQDEYVTMEHDFYIQVSNEHLETLSTGRIIFKFFRGNTEITTLSSSNVRIAMNGEASILNTEIDIDSSNYLPVIGLGDNHGLNLTVRARLPIPNLTDNYYIVAEIIDNEDHINMVDNSLEPVECSASSNNLQYYRCIIGGNTHRKDHIVIEEIILCELSVNDE